MLQFRDWFWELEAAGLGSDHFLVLRFLPDQAKQLLSVVRQELPSEFVPEPDAVNEHRTEACQRFIDQHTFDTLKSMQESEVARNIYITSSIDVCDGRLTLENTFARHEVGETDFLLALFQSEMLTVLEWRVFAGGSGYDSIEVARGENAVSFLEYLKPKNL